MAEHTRAQNQKNHTNPEIKHRKIIKEYCNKTWLLNTNPAQPQTQLNHRKIIKEYYNKTWLLNTNLTQPQTQNQTQTQNIVIL